MMTPPPPLPIWSWVTCMWFFSPHIFSYICQPLSIPEGLSFLKNLINYYLLQILYAFKPNLSTVSCSAHYSIIFHKIKLIVITSYLIRLFVLYFSFHCNILFNLIHIFSSSALATLKPQAGIVAGPAGYAAPTPQPVSPIHTNIFVAILIFDC